MRLGVVETAPLHFQDAESKRRIRGIRIEARSQFQFFGRCGKIVFQFKSETEIVVQLIGLGSKSQAFAELAHRVIKVADLEIGDSQTLMHQRIGGSLLNGSLIERDRILRFSCLDEREAKIGQCRRTMRICRDDLLK